MSNLFWSGYSKQERHEAINTLQAIVSKYGSITDFKPFSDVQITLVIETEASKIEALYEALNQTIGMDDYDPGMALLRNEITLFLTVSFAKGTGNLRIEIPAVPG